MDGLLEQAASATAQTGRMNTPSDHFRRAGGIGRAYGWVGFGSGLSLSGQASATRAGTAAYRAHRRPGGPQNGGSS